MHQGIPAEAAGQGVIKDQVTGSQKTLNDSDNKRDLLLLEKPKVTLSPGLPFIFFNVISKRMGKLPIFS